VAKTNANGNGPATVHIVLQGKGGVGKSFVSSLLAQYFMQRDKPVHCFDTDPINATLAQYPALKAQRVNVLRSGAVDEKEFDTIVDYVCSNVGVFVVDTGATTFVPLWNYVLENELLGLLSKHGRQVYIHSVVAGGQALHDTLNGFGKVAQTTAERNVIVWLNEYFGEVDGFTELAVTEQNIEKLLGSVMIRERNPHTYGDDISQMLKKRLSFDEAVRSEEFSLVSKQRLTIFRRDIFEQIDRLGLV
jgi:adenylylsulfate kinase-like enzyme